MTTLRASLSSGNWRSLLACFLYFDTGFTVWVLYGPLAPFIGKDIVMSAAQQGFLVAVPVLAAAILRVTLGNLYQSTDGRRIALLGVLLSAIPAAVLPFVPGTPSYTLLLVLGVFLGIGGASFAVALPMAGSSYPPKVQGLVLGLAAAGNIGAVLDGFLFPHIAQALGWKFSTAAALPLLAIAGFALFAWAEDRGEKSGSTRRALAAFVVSLAGLVALVLAVHAGLFGAGKTGVLLLPVLGALLAIAVLPARYRAVLAERERPQLTQAWTLGVLDGPHGAPDFFTPDDIAMLYDTAWVVHYNSSRTGVRLVGPKPRWARSDGGEAGLHPSNIHDNAYAIGAVDFTGDMPVILGP
ncbi:MAG: MFS transporter, partial [Burkholderia sp.]